MRFYRMFAASSDARPSNLRDAATALLMFLVASVARAADESGSDACKQQFRHFSEDMTVIVYCDFHVDTPDGLPAFSPECFRTTNKTDLDAIHASVRKEAKDRMNSVGKQQWCSDGLKSGRFLAGSPSYGSGGNKPETQDNGGQAKPESPVPGFACPNPHPLGELENAKCLAAANSEVCRTVDKYNVLLAQFKARHPEMDSTRKEFDRRAAVDFGCFKSLVDQKHQGLDPRDGLREAEAAYFHK